MLPLFTTGQVKDGIDSGDLLIDLSEYIKKKDAATKVEVQELTSVVANKLDAEPQHKHHIEDIKQLETALASKYDTSEKYSFNTIISDIEQIPYLEAPKIKLLSLGDLETENGYKFYVDDSNGDLMIVCNDLLVANYSKSTHNWTFGGINLNDVVDNSSMNDLETTVSEHSTVLENHSEALNAVCNATLRNITDISVHETKINTLSNSLNEYIAKTDAILKNHYEALLLLCEKHGMIDSDGTDGDKVSPK